MASEAEPGIGITGRTEIDVVRTVTGGTAEIEFDHVFADRLIGGKLGGTSRSREKRNHSRGGREAFANHQAGLGVAMDRFKRFDADAHVEITGRRGGADVAKDAFV